MDTHQNKMDPNLCSEPSELIIILGLGGEITREDIKEKLSSEEFGVNIDKDSGDIAFITYQKGETEAWVRMLPPSPDLKIIFSKLFCFDRSWRQNFLFSKI